MAKPNRASKTPASIAVVSVETDKIQSTSNRLTRGFLGAVCFLAGASIMIIEICAYRLLAPEFGNSVFTWTALIGVILIAFSAGGYLGGYLADRRLALDMLGWLLAGASVLVFFVPTLHSVLAPSLGFGDRLIAGPVVMALLLFAVPGTLLGAVSPAAVRFYSLTSQDTHVGASAGVISMLGSLGSFVGTFLSGFFLLSAFGVRSIFFGVALLLFLLAVLAFTLARNSLRQQTPILLAGLIAATTALIDGSDLPANVIYEEETFYHRIRVSDEGKSPNRRRILQLDSTQEGGMNPDTGELILPYQHFWKLVQLNEKLMVNRALFLGAGAFGMPNELSRELPAARVDVVEIDPRVIEVGRRFFQLDDHPRVTAHASDARRFLRSHGSDDEKWDLIFGDAYNGIRAIPVHLTSREFFGEIHDSLSDEGIFVMNVISAVQGPRSELLSGILAGVRTAFPYVELFAVGGGRLQDPQNVILLATKSDWRPFIRDRFFTPGSVMAKMVASYIPANQVAVASIPFTDDFNPVDAIIARGLLTR